MNYEQLALLLYDRDFCLLSIEDKREIMKLYIDLKKAEALERIGTVFNAQRFI